MEAESFGAWETIWKTLFITTLIVFSGMSVWVTIGGFHDIKKLLKSLSESEGEDSSDH
jgi:hypothetical protein